jgi:hypothetical protein
MIRRKLVWGMLAVGLVGLSLWIGSLPGLRTTSAGTSVMGCDQPRNQNAANLCPQLLCMKALREHPEIDDRADVSLDQSFIRGDGLESIHVGKARWKTDGRLEQRAVRCLMQGDTVIRSGPITADELNRIASGKEWL